MLGAGVVMRAQSHDALGHGYSRPARSPHSSRSEVVAPHGMVAARLNATGRARYVEQTRTPVRQGYEERADAGARTADVDGARCGRRLARAAGAVRDDGAGRRPRPGHRLRTQRILGERDHPGAVGRRGPDARAVARLGGHVSPRRPHAARRGRVPEPAARRHLRGDCPGWARRALQGRHCAPHRRLQRGERRLLHHVRLPRTEVVSVFRTTGQGVFQGLGEALG